MRPVSSKHLVLGLAIAVGRSLTPEAQTPDAIPVREGLVIVTAIHEPGRGDFESIKRLDAVTTDRVHLVYTAEQRGGRKVRSARTVYRKDLATARRYRNFFNHNEDRAYSGWTALGPSKAVMADLVLTGKATFTFQTSGGADRDAAAGTLTSLGTERVPVLVNGSRVELETLRAEGLFGDYRAEFWFLDDPEQPLTLRYRTHRSYPPKMQAQLDELAKRMGRQLPKLSEHELDVIKIEFPGTHAGDTKLETVESLETKLEKSGRAEVYGIYFDFGSDSIRPESEAVIGEIAALLRNNPSWRLSIEGHTDNIGSDQYNLDLSNRRAAAVKAALVTGKNIAAERLTTTGFGASRPKETNDTLAGRARNRRVELVRR